MIVSLLSKTLKILTKKRPIDFRKDPKPLLTLEAMRFSNFLRAFCVFGKITS
jgi:hypothetical protein